MEKVPSRDEIARFAPPFSAPMFVWLEKPEGATLPIALASDGNVTQMAGGAAGSAPHAQVVCFRP